ncbi:hypothetical protein NL676_009140 [Syzygium grande]|nr:hypothetical protein NL676_009140 [Syzygium grande]
MAEGHRHHHFHHQKDPAVPEPEVDYRKKEKHHKHLQQLGELGAVTAGAFALHEKHQAKKHPEHAHRHKIEEEIAAAVAVGGGRVRLP